MSVLRCVSIQCTYCHTQSRDWLENSSLTCIYSEIPESGGARKYSIYCPYVMMNKTGLTIAFKPKLAWQSSMFAGSQNIAVCHVGSKVKLVQFYIPPWKKYSPTFIKHSLNHSCIHIQNWTMEIARWFKYQIQIGARYVKALRWVLPTHDTICYAM